MRILLRKYFRSQIFFESVQHGPYTSGAELDGDIAAARRLGDTCLHLNEPQNAGRVWVVALYDLVVRYEISRNMTRRRWRNAVFSTSGCMAFKFSQSPFPARTMTLQTYSTARRSRRRLGLYLGPSIGLSKCNRVNHQVSTVPNSHIIQLRTHSR